MDLLSIPKYVIKKGRLHGHRYGKLPEDKEYNLANNLKKRCEKEWLQRNPWSILARSCFPRTNDRKTNYRDEEVCRAWDVLAEQDHTCHVSEAEYFHYRTIGGSLSISLANDTQPVRKRSDFKQALSTLKRLHQEAGGDQLEPIPCWKYKQWRPASSSSCKGNEPCTSYSRTFYDTQLWLRHCVHLHA